MAKAIDLSDNVLTTASPVPKAAQPTISGAQPQKTKSAAKAQREPLQVRWPAQDVKAAKLATIQLDFPTVSDFMLACFHAYMRTNNQS